jgi:hypothetical protein
MAALRLPTSSGGHAPSVEAYQRQLIARHDFSAARAHLIASVPSPSGGHLGMRPCTPCAVPALSIPAPAVPPPLKAQRGDRLPSSTLRARPPNPAGAAVRAWGHMKLRGRLQQHADFSAEFYAAPMAAQFSSMGSLSTEWLQEFSDSLSAGRCVGIHDVFAPLMSEWTALHATACRCGGQGTLRSCKSNK